MKDEFEHYWNKHREELIAKAPAQLREERANSTKMNTAGDWLLTAVPVIVMAGFLTANIIHNELLNFFAAAALGIATGVVTLLVKPYVTGKRSVVDIDEDIKEYYRKNFTPQQ